MSARSRAVRAIRRGVFDREQRRESRRPLAAQICLIPCEEFEELKETIEAYNRFGNR
jgi:hypothetical protein